MPKIWLISGLLLAVFSVLSLAQQAGEEPSDQERLVQLEKQVNDMQRALIALGGDGAVEMTPLSLETRLSRIELRLERLEQQVIQTSGSTGSTAGRMIDSRLRTLENAVMRLQQQR
jgi:hypothetical protein